MSYTPDRYTPSRYQTLCRLGVEQLPSLCAERGYRNDIGASSRDKREYYESVSPLGGDLPLRSLPVRHEICSIHLLCIPI